MAKVTKVEMKKAALRGKRAELAKALVEFCKEQSICVRCKNPEKLLSKESPLCDACKGYYKKYVTGKRAQVASNAALQVVVAKRMNAGITKEQTAKAKLLIKGSRKKVVKVTNKKKSK